MFIFFLFFLPIIYFLSIILLHNQIIRKPLYSKNYFQIYIFTNSFTFHLAALLIVSPINPMYSNSHFIYKTIKQFFFFLNVNPEQYWESWDQTVKNSLIKYRWTSTVKNFCKTNCPLKYNLSRFSPIFF